MQEQAGYGMRRPVKEALRWSKGHSKKAWMQEVLLDEEKEVKFKENEAG